MASRRTGAYRKMPCGLVPGPASSCHVIRPPRCAKHREPRVSNNPRLSTTSRRQLRIRRGIESSRKCILLEPHLRRCCRLEPARDELPDSNLLRLAGHMHDKSRTRRAARGPARLAIGIRRSVLGSRALECLPLEPHLLRACRLETARNEITCTNLACMAGRMND